jgi:hypothetical protein
VSRAIARYREFLPCEVLRPYVRGFFSFHVPAPEDPAVRQVKREINFVDGAACWSAPFADGHVSLVFSFGAGYKIPGL